MKSRKLYRLIFTDPALSYENHSEDFHIGIFTTDEEARAVAAHYMNHVKGFCTYPVVYRTEEKTVIDEGEIPSRVWMVEGWNTNERSDEIDVITSDCFSSETAAFAFWATWKVICPRDEWVVTAYTVGKTNWCEGFERID